MAWWTRLLIAVSLLCSGCGTGVKPVVEISGSTMGTTYHIKLVSGDLPIGENLGDEIQRRLDELNQIFTTYDAGSELSRLNQSPVDEVIQISPELGAVLRVAKAVYHQTEGAFDPTVGPLVDLWGFGPLQARDEIPSDADIRQAMQWVDFDAIELIPPDRVVRRKTVRLDLSGIAKGYAVDDLSRRLFDLGYRDFMVEIGGELYMLGHNAAGKPWQIAIESPTLVGGNPVKVIGLSGLGVATSGDYRNYFEKDGRRYSHTIDPATGRPITHRLASVTILARDTARADSLATAFMVLGADEALELAEREGIAVFLLVRIGEGFESRISSSFRQLLTTDADAGRKDPGANGNLEKFDSHR